MNGAWASGKDWIADGIDPTSEPHGCAAISGSIDLLLTPTQPLVHAAKTFLQSTRTTASNKVKQPPCNAVQ